MRTRVYNVSKIEVSGHDNTEDNTVTKVNKKD